MCKDKKQTTVIILGMHRSGTSCLAGSLQQKGLHLGPVFEWNPFNHKGNRENAEIMKLNDSILVYNNGNWDDPPTEIQWNKEHIITRNRIINTFHTTDVTVFGFKDPRTLFTLPFWIEGLSNIRLVGSFRNPKNVAKSLNKRNGMSVLEGLELWERYNNELLYLCKSHKLPLVNFDVEQNEYMSRIESIAQHLNLSAKGYNEENTFYDNKLISGRTTENDDKMTKSVSEMYSTLLKIYNKQIIYD